MRNTRPATRMGYNAYYMGLPLDTNPFQDTPMLDTQHASWRYGWLQAKREDLGTLKDPEYLSGPALPFCASFVIWAALLWLIHLLRML